MDVFFVENPGNAGTLPGLKIKILSDTGISDR